MKRAETLNKRIRKSFAVAIAKALRSVCRALHSGGTTIPRHVAGMIDSQLLSELSSEVRIIVITGTNGKTTSVHMAAHMLNSTRIQCAYSRTGENVESSEPVFMMLNYTCLMKVRKVMSRQKYVPDYWK